MELSANTIESLFTLKHRLLHFITENSDTHIEIQRRDSKLQEQSNEISALKQQILSLDGANAKLLLQLKQSNETLTNNINTAFHGGGAPSSHSSDYEQLKQQLETIKTAYTDHKTAAAALQIDNDRMKRDFDLLKVKHDYLLAKYTTLESSTSQTVTEMTKTFETKAATFDNVSTEFHRFLTLYQDNVLVTSKDMGHLHINIDQLHLALESKLKTQLKLEQDLFQLRADLSQKESMLQDYLQQNTTLTDRYEHFSKQYKHTLGLLQSNLLLGLQQPPQQLQQQMPLQKVVPPSPLPQQQKQHLLGHQLGQKYHSQSSQILIDPPKQEIVLDDDTLISQSPKSPHHLTPNSSNRSANIRFNSSSQKTSENIFPINNCKPPLEPSSSSSNQSQCSSNSPTKEQFNTRDSNSMPVNRNKLETTSTTGTQSSQPFDFASQPGLLEQPEAAVSFPPQTTTQPTPSQQLTSQQTQSDSGIAQDLDDIDSVPPSLLHTPQSVETNAITGFQGHLHSPNTTMNDGDC